MNQVTVVIVLSLALTVSAKYTLKFEFAGVPHGYSLTFLGYNTNDEGWAVNDDKGNFMDSIPVNIYWGDQDMTMIDGHSATLETNEELKPDGDCPKTAYYMGYVNYESAKKDALTALEFHSDSDPEKKCIYKLIFDVNDESQFVLRMLYVLRLQEN